MVDIMSRSFPSSADNRLGPAIRDYIMQEIKTIVNKGAGTTAISDREAASFGREWFDREVVELKKRFGSLVIDECLSAIPFESYALLTPALSHRFLRFISSGKIFCN